MTQHSQPLASAPQDLRCALQKTRSELQAKEAALKESEVERHAVVQEKDRSIAQLKCSVQDKEEQLQVTHTIPHAFRHSQFICCVVTGTRAYF